MSASTTTHGMRDFALERYFADYEFTTPYLLCCSDCESWSMKEIVQMADPETRELWDNLMLSYTESEGLTALREEISTLYSTVNRDDVLVVTPQEGILLAMSCIIEKGDHIIVTYPGYQSLFEYAFTRECKVDKWVPQPTKKYGWQFDLEFVRSRITQSTKMVVVNLPHNPTGAYIKKTEWKELVDLCQKNNVILFSDEMYRYLEDEEDRIESACDLYENAITLFGMSKSFGLPGLRIGWLVTRNHEFIQKFQAFKDYTTICSSAPSEVLALIALRNKKTILKKIKDICDKNKLLLEKFFQKHADTFEYFKSNGGPICLPKLRNGSVWDFCMDLIKKKGVLLLPSKVYDFGDQYFRLSFGRENMPDALKKLDEYLEERKLSSL